MASKLTMCQCSGCFHIHMNVAQLKHSLAKSTNAWRRRFHIHMNVAQLKLVALRFPPQGFDGFPHSYECGSIEASPRASSSTTSASRFPHSYECGSIEAQRREKS